MQNFVTTPIHACIKSLVQAKAKKELEERIKEIKERQKHDKRINNYA